MLAVLFRRGSGRRKWLSGRLRAALGGTLLCLGAVYGLARYWDISASALVNNLLGSLVFVGGTMLGAVVIVAIVVGCRRLLRGLLEVIRRP